MDGEMQWSPAGRTVLVIKDLHAAYCATPVLNGVDLSLRAGELACIRGPAGSGKTALLRSINALMSVTRGSVRVMGIEVNDAGLNKQMLRRHVGTVLHPPALFPHWTVLQNVTLPPVQVLKLPPAESDTTARALLSMFGLQGCECLYPGELSACQRQRAAIARSLAMKPDLILLDDAIAGVNPRMMKTVLQGIRSHVDSGLACILAMRGSDMTERFADRVYALDGGVLHDRIVPHAVPLQVSVAATALV